jgi:hypothetical protein
VDVDDPDLLEHVECDADVDVTSELDSDERHARGASITAITPSSCTFHSLTASLRAVSIIDWHT